MKEAFALANKELGRTDEGSKESLVLPTFEGYGAAASGDKVQAKNTRPKSAEELGEDEYAEFISLTRENR